jgi:uncharacterized protein YqjF (DUF2071 family)
MHDVPARALAGVVQTVAGAAEAVVARLAGSTDAGRQARATDDTAHRPWPLPGGPWLQGQTWNALLFMHWRVPVAALRRAVPEEVPIDTFDDTAWLGITPFTVSGLRLRGTLPPPGLSTFPETNVRTYATIDGRPGIWFLSLDAGSRLAVEAARRSYRLPYFHAGMSVDRHGDEIDYRTRRASPRAALALTYSPAGETFRARSGTLEHFLVERYCLYTLDDRRRVLRADIHHAPWPLQPARAAIAENTMTAPYGIELPDRDPLLHFAARQDVVVWPLTRV